MSSPLSTISLGDVGGGGGVCRCDRSSYKRNLVRPHEHAGLAAESPRAHMIHDQGEPSNSSFKFSCTRLGRGCENGFKAQSPSPFLGGGRAAFPAAAAALRLALAAAAAGAERCVRDEDRPRDLGRLLRRQVRRERRERGRPGAPDAASGDVLAVPRLRETRGGGGETRSLVSQPPDGLPRSLSLTQSTLARSGAPSCPVAWAAHSLRRNSLSTVSLATPWWTGLRNLQQRAAISASASSRSAASASRSACSSAAAASCCARCVAAAAAASSSAAAARFFSPKSASRACGGQGRHADTPGTPLLASEAALPLSHPQPVRPTPPPSLG